MLSPFAQHHRGILFALLGYTSFAFADANSKWLLSQGFENIQLIVTQNGLASLLLIALSPFLGGWKGIGVKAELPFHLIRVIVNFVFMLLIVHAFQILSLASIYTMIFAKPFFAVLLAMLFYGERVSLKRWAAIILGFAGVLVILRPGFGAMDINLLIPLACAFLIAVMFVVCRSLKESSPFVMSLYPIAGACLLSLPLMAGHYVEPDLTAWLHLALGAVLMSSGVTFISLAFRAADASVVSPFLYTEMIWAIMFGYLIFGDSVDLWMIAGTAIIVASGVYIMRLKEQPS
ncbi:MAG: DMT family transporter [Alphaproteobacteria bacterium]|nr:DMT family transporter [Alphaproteobacteria bacterium]MCD8520222.1 DMT family transporter [Alphaproteobacteria bacterium]MCD8525922.1 DMT family transporter [Alphaproteobacteria bacterium]MCD8570446.1 DMT family transporter [Alphaproteobacteria bacterium]